MSERHRRLTPRGKSWRRRPARPSSAEVSDRPLSSADLDRWVELAAGSSDLTLDHPADPNPNPNRDPGSDGIVPSPPTGPREPADPFPLDPVGQDLTLAGIRDRLLAVLADDQASLVPPSAGDMSAAEWAALDDDERRYLQRRQLDQLDPRLIPRTVLRRNR